MRKYNLDAIRQVRLLLDDNNNLVLNAHSNYNDTLVTAYEACILFLEGIYHSNDYPAITDHNLKNLVEAIGYRRYNVPQCCTDYERLYHVYELVYNNYKYASYDDVRYAITTLNAIMHLYLSECKVSELEFACKYYDITYSDNKNFLDESKYKDYLGKLLGIADIKLPEVA